MKVEKVQKYSVWRQCCSGAYELVTDLAGDRRIGLQFPSVVNSRIPPCQPAAVALLLQN